MAKCKLNSLEKTAHCRFEEFPLLGGHFSCRAVMLWDRGFKEAKFLTSDHSADYDIWCECCRRNLHINILEYAYPHKTVRSVHIPDGRASIECLYATARNKTDDLPRQGLNSAVTYADKKIVIAPFLP